MKKMSLSDHMYKRTWIGKTVMTDRSLGLVILVAAIAGATVTVLTESVINRLILIVSTAKLCKANCDDSSEFHEAEDSEDFSES